MATNEKRRQKKLARKKANRKAVVSAKKKKASLEKMLSGVKAVAVAKNSPVEECIVRADLFPDGIGTAVVSRRMPNGFLGVGVYLLDVFCLGMKNTYFTVLSESEYSDRIGDLKENEEMESIHPSCLRKLIDGCVEFASDLGFRPQADYKLSRQLLSDFDPSVCPNTYTFGKDGKPFYISGPNETVHQARKIVDKLLHRCGEGNFNYIVNVGGPDAD